MKHIPSVTPDVPLWTPEKPLNETQRQLQAILDYWGPNGERWCAGALENDAGQRCAMGQLNYVCYGSTLSRGCPGNESALSAMQRAAHDIIGFSSVVFANNSGFPNARAMVLRAIELAADA